MIKNRKQFIKPMTKCTNSDSITAGVGVRYVNNNEVDAKGNPLPIDLKGPNSKIFMQEKSIEIGKKRMDRQGLKTLQKKMNDSHYAERMDWLRQSSGLPSITQADGLMDSSIFTTIRREDHVNS